MGSSQTCPTDSSIYSPYKHEYIPSSSGVTAKYYLQNYHCNNGTTIDYLRTANVSAQGLVQFYSASSDSFCFLDSLGKHCYSFNGSKLTVVVTTMVIDSDHDGIQRPNDPDDLNDLNPWIDNDGDGVHNLHDAFPNDPAESVDTDHDGIGNNADLDDDNDDIPDYIDADPLNAAIQTEKIFSVNGGYKGSSVIESTNTQ